VILKELGEKMSKLKDTLLEMVNMLDGHMALCEFVPCGISFFSLLYNFDLL